MKALVDWIEAVTSIIESGFNILISTFKDIIYAIGLFAKFVIEIPTYFSWLPTEALALIGLVLSIALIKFAIGRS